MKHDIGELRMQLSYIQDCRVTLTSRRFLSSVIRWAHVLCTCNPYLCTLGGFATTTCAIDVAPLKALDARRHSIALWFVYSKNFFI